MKSCILLIAAAAVLPACIPSDAPAVVVPVESAAPAAVESGALVGVLEDRPGSTAGESSRFVIRSVFHETAEGWQAFRSDCTDMACLASAAEALPWQVSWTISHNGARLGEVTTQPSAAWTVYSDIGRQDVAAGATAPVVGERSAEFSGWAGEPVYRPLVATAPGAFSDPDGWKAGPLADAAGQAMRAQFRTLFPDVTNCVSPEGDTPAPRSYEDTDITISETHVSSAGSVLATLVLTGYRCDGPAEGAYSAQTFAVSHDGEVQHLGEGLYLLDAGDFNADGRSEFLFAIDTYNRGGYELRFNGFSGRAEFAFGYH